jgi:transcriptional regulator of acetoin/glycerol metabolism
LPAVLLDGAVAVYAAVSQLLASPAFVQQHGVYPCSRDDLLLWLQRASTALAAVEGGSGEPSKFRDKRPLFAAVGWSVFASQQRHGSAKLQLKRLIEVQLRTKIKTETPTAADETSAKPIALTPRMLRVMQALAPALQSRSPIAVTGGDGCGKATVLEALTRLLGGPEVRYQLTPGTTAVKAV